jgi:hypothetical protein
MDNPLKGKGKGKGKGIRRDFSNILPQKGTSQGPSNEYPTPKAFIEDVGRGSDSSAGKISSHGQNVETAEKAKKVIKRMEI